MRCPAHGPLRLCFYAAIALVLLSTLLGGSALRIPESEESYDSEYNSSIEYFFYDNTTSIEDYDYSKYVVQDSQGGTVPQYVLPWGLILTCLWIQKVFQL